MEKIKDAGLIINKVSHQIKRQLDESTSHSMLTGMQGRFLHFILVKYSQSHHAEVFQKDLEEEFNLRRSTATGILQLMEKGGLLYRESVNYDARLKKIIVTSKGLEMKERVEKSIRILEKKLCSGINDDDLKVFFLVMEQMLKNLEQ